jgi:prolipoprotein diacylglyceryl transferase
VTCSVSALFSIPSSIPSPPLSWQGFSIPLGEWLHFIGVPATYVINIKTYALCLLLGMIIATWLTSRRLVKRGAEPGVGLDVALFAIAFGIVGARVWHVLTHYNDYFGPGKNPWTAFYVWEGGIAIFGSILGGAIGIYFGCRLTGLRFWSFVDALVPGLLIAQAVGRFGNYFNHELYGQPTNLPWGLKIESSNAAFPVGLPAGTLFAPTFLYEMLWNILFVIILLLLERQYHFRWGKFAALYLICYGAGRIWFESIRIDPSFVIFGLRSNVWGAILAIVIGFVIFVAQSRRHPGLEPSVYKPGRGWSRNSSEVDSDETYSDTDDAGDGASHSPEIAATSGVGS